MRQIKIIFFSAVLVLMMAEGGMRLVEKLAPKIYPGNDRGDIQSKILRKFVQEKIKNLWSRSLAEKKSFYEPPFEVYINQGFDNPARLSEIAAHSRIPSNSKDTIQNFLRINEKADVGLYTVTGNNLGFRGQNRTIAKPKDTYRTIVMGSYPAFGHAVNDNETYSYGVEKLLNAESGTGQKFEVWNGGRQGGTIIMGVSRLEYEIEQYKPDLMIFDYGWIEMFLHQDVSEDAKFTSLSNVRVSNWAVPINKVCYFVREYSSLCKQVRIKNYKVSSSDALEGWRKGMNYLQSWSKKTGVPVVFLWHNGVTIPIEEYQIFNLPAEKMYFINTSQSLDAPVTKAESEEFWGSENWLSENGYTKENLPAWGAKNIFRGDAIQYNQIGYRRFARQITDFILDHKSELGITEKAK